MALEATVQGDGCRLTLRVHAYEWPEERSGSDANWLSGEVELRAGRAGTFRARQAVAFRTDELERFRVELSDVVESLNGTATLDHLEEEVGCTVELARGRGKLTAFVEEHVGPRLLVDHGATDQSYLAQTLRELETIVQTFPVRGAPD